MRERCKSINQLQKREPMLKRHLQVRTFTEKFTMVIQLTKITSLRQITVIAALMVSIQPCPNLYYLSKETTCDSILLLFLNIMQSPISSLMVTSRTIARTLMTDLRRVITKNSNINIFNECKKITSISMEDKPHSITAMLPCCYQITKTLRSSQLSDRAN